MTFRDTGKRDPGNTISRDAAYLDANNGLLIPACAADKSIIIYDILVSSGSGKLGTAADGGGTRICLINAGNNHTRAIVPKGQAVYTDAQSGNITITYAIVDGFFANVITNIVSGGGGTTTTTATPQATHISFATATSSIAEGTGGLGATSIHSVTVTSDNVNGTATVAYATADGTAMDCVGCTYVAASGTLTFGPGVTSQTIDITINADSYVSDDLTFTVALTNATVTEGTVSITPLNTHTVTVLNDDASYCDLRFATEGEVIDSIARTYSITEGDSGNQTLTVAVVRENYNSGAEARVDYSFGGGTATNGADYTGSNGTLTFDNGQNYLTFDVTIHSDTAVEGDETFEITLANAQQDGVGSATNNTAAITGTNPVTVTMVDDDTAATTTTTTATPGAYFRVEDCTASGTYYIIDDSMSYAPSVGDVVFWVDTGYTTNYCGTITQTGIGGTSVGDIQGVEDFNSDPYTCATCDSENGGP
jgi:hypothetical protein